MNSRATSLAGRLAVGSSNTRSSTSAARARLIATRDFSVRLSEATRASGSMSAPTVCSARAARARALFQSTRPRRRG